MLGRCTTTGTAACGRCSPRTPASTGGSSPPSSPPASTAGRVARSVPPKPANMRFYPSAAAAQQAGFRACKRCRPDASPGSPRVEPAGRRRGPGHAADRRRRRRPGGGRRVWPGGSATAPGRSSATCGPSSAPARSPSPGPSGPRRPGCSSRRRRCRWPRSPSPPGSPASGRSTTTVREVFATSPTELRRRAGLAGTPGGGARAPLACGCRSAGPCAPTTCSATWPPPRSPGSRSGATAALPPDAAAAPRARRSSPCAPRPDHVACRLTLGDLRDLAGGHRPLPRGCSTSTPIPVAVDELLGRRSRSSSRRGPQGPRPAGAAHRRRGRDGGAGRARPAGLDRRRPHPRRPPGARARRAGRRPAGAAHPPVPRPPRRWPASTRRRWPCPRTAAATLTALVARAASGEIDLGAGGRLGRARAALVALPGIGPWTVETIAMRALGDPDAFLPGDLGVGRRPRHSACPAARGAGRARPTAWRPWRAYAVQHLWATGDHAVNRLPA